jgi:hypothetical protein
MPHVSGIDDSCGISAHHMFLSNCVVQVMRVWSLLQPCYRLWRSTIRRGEGTLAGSAQIHVASIQPCITLTQEVVWRSVGPLRRAARGHMFHACKRSDKSARYSAII